MRSPAEHPLMQMLHDAARGVFPAPDGSLCVVPAPVPYPGAVVAFTAHNVVAVDLPEPDLRSHLPDADFGAPMSAAFLAWIGKKLEVQPGMLDVVLVHLGTTGSSIDLIPQTQHPAHARVERALHQRSQVQVYAEPQGGGLVMLGRGLVDRWEISLELTPTARNRGLGRAMIASARAMLPAEEPVFAQVSPGNARSLRAFLAAGFRPIGSEVLFH
jgi:RimJ/RimL family protein N-acetyltransferase